MLARPHRFHGYNSLRSVYGRGQNVRGPLMNLKFARRDPGRPYRVAVVVSRKVHKSAVKRNRIRRRVYECVRRTPHNIPSGTDLIFTVFSDQITELEAAKLQKLVDNLLAKTV